MTASARHQSRQLMVQALYQWHVHPTPASDLVAHFLSQPGAGKADAGYLRAVLPDLIARVQEIDAVIEPALDRPLAKLNTVELSVLRLAVFELAHRPDVPYKVIINEALELTKHFGTEGGYKYVNGVLDKLAQQIRPKEFS